MRAWMISTCYCVHAGELCSGAYCGCGCDRCDPEPLSDSDRGYEGWDRVMMWVILLVPYWLF